MASSIKIPNENEDLNDRQKEQTESSPSSTTYDDNWRCTCGQSETEFPFMLTSNNRYKLKRSRSQVQGNFPKCPCKANRHRKLLRTHSSPSQTVEISPPITTLDAPPWCILSAKNRNSSVKDVQFASENLSFENDSQEAPPPSYKSIIEFTLLDVPPDYEAVTGIPLASNLVSTSLNVTQKANGTLSSDAGDRLL